MSRSSGEKDRNNELYQTKYQGLAIKLSNTILLLALWYGKLLTYKKTNLHNGSTNYCTVGSDEYADL